jgi:hypothetical protein
MKTFTDSKGRPWELAINCDTIEAVKEACQCNVLDLLDPESDLTREATAFPPVIAKLLFAAVTDQAKSKEVDDREFRICMGGDNLADAYDALLEELISFCPRHRRQVAGVVLAKNREVQEAAAGLAIAKLSDPTLKAQVLDALEANLTRQMKAALENLNPNANPNPQAENVTHRAADSETESSNDVGSRPDCLAFPVLARTPGDSSAD